MKKNIKKAQDYYFKKFEIHHTDRVAMNTIAIVMLYKSDKLSISDIQDITGFSYNRILKVLDNMVLIGLLGYAEKVYYKQ